MHRLSTGFLLVVLWISARTFAYTASPTLYQQQTRIRPSTTSSTTKTSNTFSSLGLEAPDLSLTFANVHRLSPLARSAMRGEPGINDLPWKTVSCNPNGSVHKIEKIDNYEGRPAPMLRFKSSFQGLTVSDFKGPFFAAMKEFFKNDICIDTIEEMHSLDETEMLELAMEGMSGECTRMGVAYGTTRKAYGISPRHTLFLFGMNECPDGSIVLWGEELSEANDHLLPNSRQQYTRSKMHLFAATLKPTGDKAFDAEYVLQLESGGRVPQWMTVPMLIDTVKGFFETARKECAAGTSVKVETSNVLKHVEAKRNQHIAEKTEKRQFHGSWQGLLVPV